MRARFERLVLESLESRRLMSAGVVLGDDGVLLITGTEKRDVVTVSLAPKTPGSLQVRLNGRLSTFAVGDVTAIRAETLGGNDTVSFSEKFGRIVIPAEVYAGAGNDVITTASGNDLTVAGDGKDKVVSGAGDDQIDAGAGDDAVTGGADNDRIYGQAGKDQIDAGTGNDDVDGGAGKDRVVMGTGTDNVDAGTLAEVRRSKTPVTSYTVSQDAELQAQFTALCQEVVPGSQVRRVQVASDGTITALYTFGEDPQLYTVIVSTSSGEFDLVSREISPAEFRPSAVSAFASNNANMGIRSILQRPGGTYDVRFIGTDGVTRTKTTHVYVFTVDDAGQDSDNDGLLDSMGPGDIASL